MPKLGVFTSNFLFYHNIVQLLKRMNVPFELTSASQETHAQIIISALGDPDAGALQIRGNDPLGVMRKVFPRVMGKSQFSKIVIGIDPGPRPGVAVMGDSVLLEAFEIVDPHRISRVLSTIMSDYDYKECVVRLGDGDLPNRKIIERELLVMRIPVKIVDESNTSFPHNLHNNALSAARIARSEDSSYRTVNFAGLKRKEIFEREFVTIRKFLT